MPKIIIGLHGLGNKPDNNLLADWWKKSISEGLEKIGHPEEKFNFEMIYWANILNENPLNENETDPENKLFIKEKYIPASKDFVERKVELKSFVDKFFYDQFDKIFLDPDFRKNHEMILEFIVKKYFRELGIYYSDEEDYKDYRNIIMYKILSVLKKYEHYDIFLIAHSMGSIIAYDVLTFLAPKIKIAKLITIGSPLGLPIIIEKIKTDTKSKDKPKTPDNVLEWINLADKEDKIAMKSSLNEYFAPNKYGVIPKNYFITNNYEVEGQRNPHKSYGYLRATKFSQLLYEFLTQKEKSWLQKKFDYIKENLFSLKNKFTTNFETNG